MKRFIISSLCTLIFCTAFAQYRTERTGYEGDNFSLEGALDLFKESSSLRDFERKINTEKYWVNNLDLDYDGRIDYVRVEHRQQGNFHAIILQALVGRYDVQDVAVIELEVIRRGEALLQIIGDEDLYGEEVYVEPVEGYSDSRRGYHSDYGDYVNVYYWRPVQYILGRGYSTYVSPYRYQYYPTWWAPRVQISWNIFRPRIVVYNRYYHIVRRHRVIRVHNFYRPYRSYCGIVVNRANDVRVRQGRAPIYRPEPPRNRDRGYDSSQGRTNTAGRTEVTRPRPNTSSISRNRTRTEATRGDISRSSPRTRPDADRSATGRSEISRTNIPRQSAPSLSRKRSQADAAGSSTPRSQQRSSRSSVERREPSRSTMRSSTPSRTPSTSRNSTPSYKREPSKSRTQPSSPNRSQSTPQMNRSSRSEINRSGSSRSSSSSRSGTRASTPTRKPSVNRSGSGSRSPSPKSSAPQQRSTQKVTKSRKRSGGE